MVLLNFYKIRKRYDYYRRIQNKFEHYVDNKCRRAVLTAQEMYRITHGRGPPVRELRTDNGVTMTVQYVCDIANSASQEARSSVSQEIIATKVKCELAAEQCRLELLEFYKSGPIRVLDKILTKLNITKERV